MENSNGQAVNEEKTQEMGLPHVTSFCYCFDLESGAFCVGGLHMLASVLLMISCSIFADNVHVFIGTVEDAEDHLYSTWYKIGIGAAVLSAFHILLAGLLVVSIYKRSVSGLRAWLIVMLILLAAALVFILVNVCKHGFSNSGSEIFLSFFEGVLFFGVVGYCILLVYSYSLMLKSHQDMAGPDKADY